MVQREFDRQVENLLQKGYPKAEDLEAEEFVRCLAPLRERVGRVETGEVDLDAGRLSLVIVITSALIPTDAAMGLVEREGKPGCTKLYPREVGDFAPIEDVSIPKGPVYLLVDIDRGKGSLNVAPSEAMKTIRSAGRSPLTIEEGVAIVTHYPDFLRKNNCFSLLASRHSGDKRVPAIWINREKQPNLGWCWDGNPHTWLGSASCGARIGT